MNHDSIDEAKNLNNHHGYVNDTQRINVNLAKFVRGKNEIFCTIIFEYNPKNEGSCVNFSSSFCSTITQMKINRMKNYDYDSQKYLNT